MHSWSAGLPGALRLSSRGLGPTLPCCPGPRPAELKLANTHVLTSTHTHACIYKHTYAHAHTHVHVCMLTCVHMHAHIRAHIYPCPLAPGGSGRIWERGAKGRKKVGSLFLDPFLPGAVWRGGAPRSRPRSPLPCPGPSQPAASPGHSSEMHIPRPHPHPPDQKLGPLGTLMCTRV